jgi:hypothetical protein
MLRSAGHEDPARLVSFLDAHAAPMPRTALRYAIEKLSPAERAHYLALKTPEVRALEVRSATVRSATVKTAPPRPGAAES